MMRRLIVGKRGRYCGLFAVCVAALACGSGPNGGTGGTSGGGANPPPFGEDEAGVNPVPLPPGEPGEPPDSSAFGNRPVYNPLITQAVAPPPISGGTLVVSSDGSHAFAADPDRDALYIVDLMAGSSVTVALEAGDEPGRLVEDAAGVVHVALRRGGAVASIDPTTNAVLSRTSVCSRPRGIAYMASNDSVYVACAGGELVTLPAAGGAPTRTVVIEPDLRDVVVVGSNLYVSELRSAAILQIAADGVDRKPLHPADVNVRARRGVANDWNSFGPRPLAPSGVIESDRPSTRKLRHGGLWRRGHESGDWDVVVRRHVAEPLDARGGASGGFGALARRDDVRSCRPGRVVAPWLPPARGDTCGGIPQ